MSRVTLLAPGDVVRSCEAELAQRNINVRVVAWEEVVEGNAPATTDRSHTGGTANRGVQPKDVRDDVGTATTSVRRETSAARTAHAGTVVAHGEGETPADSGQTETNQKNDRRTHIRGAERDKQDGDEKMAAGGAAGTRPDTMGVEEAREDTGGKAIRVPEDGGGGTTSGSRAAHADEPGGKPPIYVADQRIRDGLAGEINADVRVFSSTTEVGQDAIFLSLGASLLKSLGVPKDAVSKQKDSQMRIRKLGKMGQMVRVQHYEAISTLHDDFGRPAERTAGAVRSGVVLVSNDPTLSASAPVVFTVPTGDTTWKNTMRVVTARRNVRVYKGDAAEAKQQLLALVDAI
uniref:VP6 n=1 Tax=Fomede virus TaxID=2547356 RepID=A0A482A264_9REOV|nr:VP6 [Fomede virus]